MSSSAPWKSASEPLDAPAGTNWLPPSPAAVAAAAEELHGVGDDLDRLALGAVLGVPLAPLEPAVDRDRPSLREVLRAALALVAPDGDVEVVRLLGPLAGRESLRRVLTAMRRLQTAVPRGVCRSSGSRVRLPTSTTRLMLAMVPSLLSEGRSRLLGSRVDVIAVIGRAGGGRAHGDLRRRPSMWPPLTRRYAPWRMTPSVILRTRVISASVSGGQLKSRRW